MNGIDQWDGLAASKPWEPSDKLSRVLGQRSAMKGHIDGEMPRFSFSCRRTWEPDAPASLFFFVASLQLMSNRQDQYDVLSGHPTIFGHVAEAAARQYQFTAAVFGLSAQQRMIRE
jgi:hypothetical protein